MDFNDKNLKQARELNQKSKQGQMSSFVNDYSMTNGLEETKQKNAQSRSKSSSSSSTYSSDSGTQAAKKQNEKSRKNKS